MLSEPEGTVAVTLTLTSAHGGQRAGTVRVLINSREPDQRGTFIEYPRQPWWTWPPIPSGTVIMSCARTPIRCWCTTRMNNTQVASLRTYTRPIVHGLHLDRRYLLVGLTSAKPWRFRSGHLDGPDRSTPPRRATCNPSLPPAEATRRFWRWRRRGTPDSQRRFELASPRPSIPPGRVRQHSTGGRRDRASSQRLLHMLAAASDGTVMLYDANVDSFTVSRKDFAALAGAYAASSLDQFVVGNTLLNSSGVPAAHSSNPRPGISSGFCVHRSDGILNHGSGLRQPRSHPAGESATGSSIRSHAHGGSASAGSRPAAESTRSSLVRWRSFPTGACSSR